MARTSRKTDKDILAGLATSLQASQRNIGKDPCGDWRLRGRRGHIFCDGAAAYVYLPSGTKQAWTYAKRALGFMEVTQDGEEEGILRLRGTPSAEQAEIIRDYVGLSKAPVMTEERREALRSNFSSIKPGRVCDFIALAA